jgi:hypothetical protein
MKWSQSRFGLDAPQLHDASMGSSIQRLPPWPQMLGDDGLDRTFHSATSQLEILLMSLS